MEQDFLAQVEALAKDAGRNQRIRRAKLFPQQSLTWLALAPVWPVELARQGFPVEERSIGKGPEVDTLLQRAVDNQLGVQEPDMLWPEGTLRLNDGTRRSILENLADDPEEGEGYIRRQLFESAEGMDSAAAGDLGADPRLQRWVTLARAAGDEQGMAKILEDQVQAAIQRAEDGGSLSAPEAVAWIKTAVPLGDLLGGSLAITVLRCERRVELFHRRSNDIRLLSNYFVREEYDRAFLDLLEDERHWALHFIGVGGTGKTMTLRHIAHDFTEKQDLATARVDFDYLNPDYPFRAPGLLLVELSEDLRLQISDSSAYLFSRFDDAVKALKDRIQGEVHRTPLERPTTSDPQFREMIEYFAQALRNLGNRRPVLILDTCEELAKIKPDGSIPDNVQVTFEILEMLHEELPEMRVILSGRRDLPEKPYLRVVRIRGFTASEASRFLADFTIDERHIDPSMHQPILDLTRVSMEGEEPRHNPYDLDMYASWAVGDPDLSAERLAEGGSHHYVKERIVGRLAPALRILLRSLVLIRRFDQRLLEDLLEDDPNRDNLIREINELEIIEHDQSAVGSLLINPTLRERLLDYYKHEQHGTLMTARRRVADLLERLTLEWGFSALTPQHFAAALDNLSDDPPRAARWWNRVEQRIRRERQWTWALETLRTFEEEPALVDNRSTSIAAAVEATMVACSAHTGDIARNPETLYNQWAGVQAQLRRFPEGEEHRLLTLRVELALAATRPGTAAVPPLPGEAAGEEELQATYIAYLESFTELAEIRQPAADRLSPVLTGLRNLLEVIPEGSHIAAFALCLEARLALVDRRPVDAGRGFRAAIEIADKADRNQKIEDHLDWTAPESLPSRLRLEEMRAWSRLERSDDDFRAAAQFNLSETIDDDRLAAMILQGLEAQEPLRSRSETRFRDSLGYVLVEPRCNAHREIQPYYQVVLEADARAGSVRRALDELRELSEKAETVSRLELSRQLDRARLRIILRMHLLSERYSIPSSLQSAQDDKNVHWMWLAQSFYENVANDCDCRQRILESWMEGPVQGLRRTAEIALLNANLPMEEDGSRNIPRIREAVNQFAACGDYLSSLLAWIAEDLKTWSVQARPGSLRPGGLADLESVYRRATNNKAIPGWPSWNELREIVGTGRAPFFLDGLKQELLEWRPWLARLCICLAYHLRLGGGQVRADLHNWLLSNYSRTYEDGIVLPRDLRFVTGETLQQTHVSQGPPQGAPLPELSSPESATSGFWQKLMAVAWGEVGLGILGISFISAFLWIAYHFLGRGMAAVGLPTTWTIRLPVLFAILALSTYSRMITSAILTWCFRFFFLGFRFRYSSLLKDPAFPMQSPGEMVESLHCRIGPIRWNFTPPGGAGFELQPTEVTNYRRLAPALLGNTAGLARIHRLSWSGFHNVEVIVDERSAGGPWEVALGLPSERNDRFDSNRFRFRRTTTGQHKRVQPDLPTSMRIWAVCDNEGPRRELDRFLRRVEAHSPVVTRSSESLDKQSADSGFGFLYLCGVPMGGTSGLRIRTSLGHESTPDMIHPRELPLRFGRLRLMVLQIPPAPLAPRSSGDRKEAAFAKLIGAELFESGIPAILIVPPLLAELNDILFDGLDKLIRKAPRNATPLLVELARGLQEAIAKQGDDAESRETALERAFDVCLYAEESVNLKVKNPQRQYAKGDAR